MPACSAFSDRSVGPPADLVLARGLGPQLGRARQVVAIVDQPRLDAVVGRLARQLRRRVPLVLLDGVRQEVVVVLQHVELLVVAGQDPDAVQVPLGDVLERAGVLAQPQQDAVAIEGTLALAAALEVVGQQLQQPLRHRQLAVGAAAIIGAQQRLTQVEVRQRGLVRHARQARIAHHALPLHARRRVRARGLELDRRQRRVPRLGQHARRLAVAPLA